MKAALGTRRAKLRRALRRLLPTAPNQRLPLAEVLACLGRATSKAAPCRRAVANGALGPLSDALRWAVADDDLEVGYYACRALENVELLGGVKSASLRTAAMRPLLRFIRHCAASPDDGDGDALAVGRVALSLLSRLLDGLPGGRVAILVSSPDVFRAVCTLAATSEDTEGGDDSENVALRLAVVVVEECGWRVEDPIHAVQPDPAIVISLALACPSSPRAAQMLRRGPFAALVGGLAASEKAAEAGGNPAGPSSPSRIPPARWVAAIRAVLSLTGSGDLVADRTLGWGRRLAAALRTALRRSIPQERGGFPEADFAKAVATQRAIALWAASGRRGTGLASLVRHGPWVALRFDGQEQGIAYCPITASSSPFSPPTCPPVPSAVGYEYVRVQAAAGLAALHCAAGDCLTDASTPTRVLVVGLGTGALPAFLAIAPGLDVHVCEIDPKVIAAIGAHIPWGSPFHIHAANAVRWVRQPEFVGAAAAVFLDPYDSQGRIPAPLRTQRFLGHCVRCLGPHGALVVNVFSGPPGSHGCTVLEGFCVPFATALKDGVLLAVEVARRPSNIILLGWPSPPMDGGAPISRRALIRGAQRALGALLAGHPRPPWPWRASDLLSGIHRVDVQHTPIGPPTVTLTLLTN